MRQNAPRDMLTNSGNTGSLPPSDPLESGEVLASPTYPPAQPSTAGLILIIRNGERLSYRPRPSATEPVANRPLPLEHGSDCPHYRGPPHCLDDNTTRMPSRSPTRHGPDQHQVRRPSHGRMELLNLPHPTDLVTRFVSFRTPYCCGALPFAPGSTHMHHQDADVVRASVRVETAPSRSDDTCHSA